MAWLGSTAPTWSIGVFPTCLEGFPRWRVAATSTTFPSKWQARWHLGKRSLAT